MNASYLFFDTLVLLVLGRYSIGDIVDPVSDEVLLKSDLLINTDAVAEIEESSVYQIKVRSVLTCESRHGVCSRCYGINLAN